MDRLKLATVWLGGCSGCHMSFLDLDEWLFDLAARVELVYSPLADTKEFPEQVDVTLVEGAIANEENLALAQTLRARSRVVVSFGDCAVTGNVTALRNPHGRALTVLEACYRSNAKGGHGDSTAGGGASDGRLPNDWTVLPPLVDQVLPLHQVIPVDYYLPGCPPPASRIRQALEELLAGQAPARTPELIRFG